MFSSVQLSSSVKLNSAVRSVQYFSALFRSARAFRLKVLSVLFSLGYSKILQIFFISILGFYKKNPIFSAEFVRGRVT